MMIKFFRNIRKKLLAEGNTRKYLKYAIGEIVLVMIGILLALQVNNWNENRKLNKLKISYYENLLTDLVKDSIDINKKIRYAKSNARKLNNVLRFIENGYDIKKSEIDSILWAKFVYSDTLALIHCVSQAGFIQLPTVYENTITDLRSTGNIKLIENPKIKKDVISYYNYQKTFDFWNQTLLPAATDMEKNINKVLNREERVAYTTTEGLTKDKVNFEGFVTALKTTPEFKTSAIGMLHLQHRIIMWNKYFPNLEKLKNDLRTEIKTFKD